MFNVCAETRILHEVWDLRETVANREKDVKDLRVLVNKHESIRNVLDFIQLVECHVGMPIE